MIAVNRLHGQKQLSGTYVTAQFAYQLESIFLKPFTPAASEWLASALWWQVAPPLGICTPRSTPRAALT